MTRLQFLTKPSFVTLGCMLLTFVLSGTATAQLGLTPTGPPTPENGGLPPSPEDWLRAQEEQMARDAMFQGPEIERMQLERRRMERIAGFIEAQIAERSQPGAPPEATARLREDLRQVQAQMAELDRRLPNRAPTDAEADSAGPTLPPMGRSTLLRLRGQLEASLDDLEQRMDEVEDPTAPEAEILRDEHATALQQLQEVYMRLRDRGQGFDPQGFEPERDSFPVPDEVPDLSRLLGEESPLPDRQLAPSVSELVNQRLKLLTAAAENLRAAGYDDLAELVMREADRLLMPSEPPRGSFDGFIPPPAFDDESSASGLEESVRQLREQVEQMRLQMQSLQKDAPGGDEE